jgi:hypothetical protein
VVCESLASNPSGILRCRVCWRVHDRLLLLLALLLLLLLQGWCVKALQAIPQGSFVAEYAGEYVTGSEAERRLAQYDTEERGHALLVSRLGCSS